MPDESRRSRFPDPSADRMIDRLIAGWQAGRPVPMADLLPPDPGASLVANLACEEIELRLKAGEPARAADYLDRFPQLAADEFAPYLLDAEILSRKKFGPPPDAAEYRQRFPQLRSHIDRLLGLHPLPDSPPGYELVEEIGHGGMGVVYRGRDVTLNREVAVKVLQAKYPPGSDAARRFVEEARITGRLQHPGIPAVHQVGTLADGRPMLVMKLIRGRTLASLIREQATLNVPAVFEAVCQAVAAAHDQGVIHRDLKPENVMVGAFGEVQVMDWGLAKVMGETTAAPTSDPISSTADTGLASRTRDGAVLGTPYYMAPEQAAGDLDRVDRRADVYALGGVLCAMLTGKPPVEGPNAAAVLAAAVRGDTAEALERLAGSGADPAVIDLCRRCLAFQPADRPADAGELAVAVARLRAAADERAKQAEVERGKATVEAAAQQKRRRLVQWGGGLLAGVLLAGIVGTSVGLVQANEAREAERQRADAEAAAKRDADEQRDLARTNERKANDERDAKDVALEALKKALQAESRANEDLWAGLDVMTAEIVGHSLGTQKAISEEQKAFLGTVLPLYRKLADRKGRDEVTRAQVAHAALRVGTIQYRLGRNAEGAAALKEAQGHFADLAVEFPAVPRYRADKANSHSNLGVLLRGLRRSAEAEKEYRAALTLFQTLADQFPATAEYRADLAASHTNLGNLLDALGQGEEAEIHHRIALALREKLAVEFPAVPRYRADKANSHSNLGVLLRGLRRSAEAEKEYRAALTLFQTLADQFPATAEYRADLAASHTNLGNLLFSLRQGVEAEKQFRIALTMFKKLAVEFPGIPQYLADLATTHNSLGRLLKSEENLTGAEHEYRAALGLWRRLVADFPAIPSNRTSAATTHTNLGDMLAGKGQVFEAEKQYRAALAFRQKLAAEFPSVPEYRTLLVTSHSSLGDLLKDLGHGVEAETEYRAALVLREKLADDFPNVLGYQIDLGGTYSNLGSRLRDAGQAAESLDCFHQAIATLGRIYSTHPRELKAKLALRNSYWGRAKAFDQLDKYADAMEDWRKAVELSPPNEKPIVRADHAFSQVRTGRVKEGVAEFDVLTELPNWNDLWWYDFACIYSVAASKGEVKRQRYSDQAISFLQKAVKAGYKDATKLKKDTDLDPLRDRDDFKKLLADLEAKYPREQLPPPRPDK